MHGQLSKHASVCKEKYKSSCAVGQSSGIVEGSSSHGHGSISHVNAPDVVIHSPVAYAPIEPAPYRTYLCRTSSIS